MHTVTPHYHPEQNAQEQQPVIDELYRRMRDEIDRRKQTGTFRTLRHDHYTTNTNNEDGKQLPAYNARTNTIDFSSNDYLGLARSKPQIARVETEYASFLGTVRAREQAAGNTQITPHYKNNNNKNNNNRHHNQYLPDPILGSTGSRLLSGDSTYAHVLEEDLATLHNRESAMLFNSGYDANLSILSCLPYRRDPGDDVVIMDELCHNSLRMGIRMSRIMSSPNNANTHKHDSAAADDAAAVRTFRHNRVDDLRLVILSCISTAKQRQNQQRERQARNSIVVYVVIESVYSMEGDVAPLADILDLAASLSYTTSNSTTDDDDDSHTAPRSCSVNVHVIVDEAHGLGVYGVTNARDLMCVDDEDEDDDKSMLYSRNTCTYSDDADIAAKYSPPTRSVSVGGMGALAALGLERHPALLCSIHTFGKAAGCHGAVVCGSAVLKQYLINYARPLIYSTCLDVHSLVCIRCAYQYFGSAVADGDRAYLFDLVRFFRHRYRQLVLYSTKNHYQNDIKFSSVYTLLPSPSPIQSIVIPGNEKCKSVADQINSTGFDVYPIRAPTVPAGSERIRIILHVHNTRDNVEQLVKNIWSILATTNHDAPTRAKL